jgi:hypothetical protein
MHPGEALREEFLVPLRMSAGALEGLRLASQLAEACGWSEPPRYIVHDRDGAYGNAFMRDT